MGVVVILCLILLNGLLAMSEMAVISARRTSLDAEARRGGKKARAALKLAENPDRFLSTVQVGITLTGILTGLYSGDVLAVHFVPVLEGLGLPSGVAGGIARVVVVVVVTFLTIIFGELVPKRIGMSAAESVARAVAGPMEVLSVVAWPFVWLLSRSSALVFRLSGVRAKGTKVTEEEIKSLVREGTEDGEVREVEQDIVERVFTLGDRDLGSIMTHRSDIVWIDVGMTREEIVPVVEKTPFDKYPVAEGSLDEIVGMVYIKDMFLGMGSAEFDLRAMVRPAEYLYENMEVYSALERMKAGHLQCALVCDEFGTVKGMVTLIDIMEALVGDIPEAHDEPEIVERKEGGWLVDGQCSFYDFLEYFDIVELYPGHDHNTVGGLILAQLGDIPQAGETTSWRDFTFEVVDMDGARIDKVLVTKKSVL